MLGLSRIVLIGICILIGWGGAVECCLAQGSAPGFSAGGYHDPKTGERVFMMGGGSVEQRSGSAGFIESGNSFPPRTIELTYREVMQRAASRNFDIALQNEVVNEASIAITEKSSYFYPNISLRPTFVRTDTYERFDSITRPRVQSPEFDPLQQRYFDQIQAGKVLNGIDILSECSVSVDGRLVYNGFAYAQPKCLPIPTTAIEFPSYADARPYESFNLVTQVGQLMRFGGYASFSLRTGYDRKASQYVQVSGTDTAFIDQSRAYVTSLSFGFSTSCNRPNNCSQSVEFKFPSGFISASLLLRYAIKLSLSYFAKTSFNSSASDTETCSNKSFFNSINEVSIFVSSACISGNPAIRQ